MIDDLEDRRSRGPAGQSCLVVVVSFAFFRFPACAGMTFLSAERAKRTQRQWPVVGSQLEDSRAEQSQFGAVRGDEMRQTNPIGPVGLDLGGRNLRNKPNLLSAAQGPRGSRARTPNPRRADLCETNPIRAWRTATSGPKCAKQTQSAPAGKDRWGKPHPTDGRGGAKQTQFSPPGAPTSDSTPQPSAGLRRDSLYKQSQSGDRRAASGGRNAPNKGKLGRTGLGRQRGIVSGAASPESGTRETKPISARRADLVDLESATVCRPYPFAPHTHLGTACDLRFTIYDL
jgi:hypothetical protein